MIAANTAPTATEREDFAQLLPPGQLWFTPKEVAQLIGTSDQYVRNAFEDQRILGFLSSATSSGARRRCYRIHRDAVLLFLLETANHEPRDFSRHLAELLKRRSTRQLRELYALIEQRLQGSG